MAPGTDNKPAVIHKNQAHNPGGRRRKSFLFSNMAAKARPIAMASMKLNSKPFVWPRYHSMEYNISVKSIGGLTSHHAMKPNTMRRAGSLPLR